MITLFILLVLVICIISLNMGNDDGGVMALTGLSGIILFFLIASKFINFTTIISYDQDKIFLQHKKDVYQKQVVEVETIIRAELSKYPDIEKEIFNKIKSGDNFIVAYPQIKSNTTILESAKTIKAYRNQIYDTEIAIYELDKDYVLSKKYLLWL